MSNGSEVSDQGSSTTGQDGATGRRGVNRRAVLALVIALVFVAAVLGGAKILVDRNVYTAVAMGPVDSPAADSQTCADVVGALPDRTSDYRSVGVADPAPAGTAAYRDSGGTELTVRCGVNLPAQYSVLSETTGHGGVEWLQVTDATPGSDLTTWYSVGTSPVVAVTGSHGADDAAALSGVGTALAGHTDGADAPAPAPVPLADLRQDAASGAAADRCTGLLDGLPDGFGDYRRIAADDPRAAELPDNAAAWTAPGLEPVVVRCGVRLSDSYRAGAQLTQVNDVPWFEDTALAQGSTAGVWYALGYAPTVAVSLPTDAGNQVLTQVSEQIAGSFRKTGE
jgi:hypothetical protein